MRIALKKEQPLLEIIHSRGVKTPGQFTVSDEQVTAYITPGNCIQASIVIATGCTKAPLPQPQSTVRSYQEVASHFDVQLTGKLAVDACQQLAPGSVLEPGHYLLHSEMRGVAHCVLLQADSADASTGSQSLTIFDVGHDIENSPSLTKTTISTDNLCKAGF
jgi:hypothetical protein